jgi:hypothetical protein
MRGEVDCGLVQCDDSDPVTALRGSYDESGASQALECSGDRVLVQAQVAPKPPDADRDVSVGVSVYDEFLEHHPRSRSQQTPKLSHRGVRCRSTVPKAVSAR